jgi:hypothetical protein
VSLILGVRGDCRGKTRPGAFDVEVRHWRRVYIFRGHLKALWELRGATIKSHLVIHPMLPITPREQ